MFIRIRNLFSALYPSQTEISSEEITPLLSEAKGKEPLPIEDNATQTHRLDTLPSEMILMIINHLDWRDLAQLAKTSSFFNTLIGAEVRDVDSTEGRSYQQILTQLQACKDERVLIDLQQQKAERQQSRADCLTSAKCYATSAGAVMTGCCIGGGVTSGVLTAKGAFLSISGKSSVDIIMNSALGGLGGCFGGFGFFVLPLLCIINRCPPIGPKKKDIDGTKAQIKEIDQEIGDIKGLLLKPRIR